MDLLAPAAALAVRPGQQPIVLDAKESDLGPGMAPLK